MSRGDNNLTENKTNERQPNGRKVEIMSKKVIDEFNREVEIDENTRKLYSFSNKDKKITYNAEIVENGKNTGFWTNYTEAGTVESLEEKLKMWNNGLLLTYSVIVGFKANENDPNKEIYNAFVEVVKQNEDKLFTKKGDFRKKFLISEAEIIKMVKR